MSILLCRKLFITFAASFIVFLWVAASTTQSQTRRNTRTTPAPASPEASQIPDTERLAQLEALVAQPPAERLEGLRKFVASFPNTETREPSPLRTRAIEQLVSTLAAVGDEFLTGGNTEAGIKHFREAIAAAPAKMSEKLFVQIISQLPSNLFLRGEQAEAFDIARRIEAKINTDPQSLLALATFYLSVEQADEAARLIELSLRYAETATARIALGAARRLNLQLDESITEYKRALELDATSATSATARRALADLYRAVGKPAEAITLYDAQLAATPDDAVSRAGYVLSLFDMNRREAAERELKIALEKSPEDLTLLTGAAYWYAAQTEAETARAYAGRAVVREPRYTWAHIANARALIMLKRPLEAERSLRLAAQFGDFPTLSYELANALAASGFYEEAANELARTFRISPDGEISARLANRIETTNGRFIELLAPERRASIYQPTAADSDISARRLAALLAFHTALTPETNAANTPRKRGAPKQDKNALTAEAREKILLDSADTFASGNDEMRFYRQLYVIERLVKRASDVTPAVRDRVMLIAEAATATVEIALDAPTATEAAFADELRKTRLDAIAVGTTPQLPRVPRQVISAVVRGRLEDARGRALAYSGKAEEGLPYLRRAATVLPDGTVWSRANAWHTGTALEALGNNSEALAAYIKSYRAAPDPVRRAVIENLYRRLNNNSIKGLDNFINAQATRAASSVTNK